jgi:hypothetical protein
MPGRPWIIAVLVGASLLALVLARRGDERQAYGTCLSSAECLKAEVCAVSPKGDGFATLGTCTSPCSAQADCLNGWTCAPFVDLGGYLVSTRATEAQGSKGAARMVCAPPVR